jgi:hypothetical protein
MLRAVALAAALAVGLLTSPTATGQQIPAQPTNLVLEVYYHQNEAPLYITVPPADSEPGGMWSVRFRRVPGWKTPAGSLPVRAVNVQTIQAGDRVRVWVSVFVGLKGLEQEDRIAAYSLREGEKITVGEVTKVGVEPFELALVRVGLGGGNLPPVISKAKSIELVTIRGNLSTLPSYRVALRNLSARNVSALFICVGQDVRTQITSMPQGEAGGPLILAGDVSEFDEPAVTTAAPTPGGYQPLTAANQTIEISTAVFDDGSFEGEIGPAILFRGFVKGRKIQLGRLVGLFQVALRDNNPEPQSALDLLRNNIAALGIEADPAAVQEAMSEFPSLKKGSEPRLRSPIQIAMTGIRKDALDDLQRFRISNPKVDSSSFRAWLTESEKRYETWLSRL